MAMAGPDVPLLGKTDHDESQDERNTTAHAVDATVEGHGAPWWRSGLRTAAVVLTLAAVGYTAYTSGVITSTAAPTTSLSEEGSDYFFSVDVSNEYTASLGHPGRLYPHIETGRVVEPHRTTTLTASASDDLTSNGYTLSSCDWTVADELAQQGPPMTAAGGDAYAHLRGLGEEMSATASLSGTETSLTFTAPGSYTVDVTCTAEKHSDSEQTEEEKEEAGPSTLSLTQTITLECMYVRRELRQLSDDDRVKLLDAMYTISVTPTEEGRTTYGANYRHLDHFVAIHLERAGGRHTDKMHDGMGVLTQHAALSAEYELALQSVDPSLSLHYWDFTIDYVDGQATEDQSMRYIYTKSELFSDKWFGSAHEKEHHIENSKFAQQLVSYANASEFSVYSPYGYMRAPWNLNPSKFVTRFRGMCGQIETYWPTCSEHHTMVFSDHYTSWFDWVWEISYGPHGPIHTWLGGLGSDTCEEDFEALYDLLPGPLVSKAKTSLFILVKTMFRDGFLNVPKYCSVDSTEDCRFICEKEKNNEAFHKYFAGTMKSEGVEMAHLTQEEKEKAINIMLCDANYYPGDHIEAASPVESSFWPIHPTLERLFQFKEIVKPFTDRTWDVDKAEHKHYCTYHTYGCEGHHAYDLTSWFTVSRNDDGVYVKSVRSNEEVRTAANPNTLGTPYIYHTFEWDHCTKLGVDFTEP